MFALTADANPRSPEAMLQAAQRQLTGLFAKAGRRAPALKPELLRSDSDFRIYGYKGSAFVVVSTDDCMPEVLGYSDADAVSSNGKNPNFEWWLDAVKNATSEAKRSKVSLTATAPDTTKYKAQIPALLTCKWGQETPFNKLCPTPSSSDNVHTLTGCVATAMAQILYYHKAPSYGVGIHSVNYDGNEYTVDFGKANYDWDNMIDVYSDNNYSDVQANAVATIMFHCGVASDMQYGVGSSGTYTKNASDGLKRNFGLSEAVHLEDRFNYSTPDWMDLVYTEINANRPILYTGYSGNSVFTAAGHAFVLDGYDNTGKVHINWGWNGDDNGMFEISTLAVRTYQYSNNQQMVIGISPEKGTLVSDTVATVKAGELAGLIPDSVRTSISELKIIGEIDTADLAVIRYMAGVDKNGNATKGHLYTLDLSEANFVGGDHAVPDTAFLGVRLLSVLTLPDGIKHIGDGALATSSLREVVINPATDADFIVDDDVVWSADTTSLIAVLPYKSGKLTLPSKTRTIHPYAITYCLSINSLVLSDSLKQIGARAISYMENLEELRMRTVQPPLCEDGAVSDINFSTCKLYVPRGSKQTYRRNSEFGKFYTRDYDNIVEFGTAIKARNAIKIYGDPVPVLGWKIEGDAVHGEPMVTTDVDETTPVGRYPIHISRGTIVEDDFVSFEDGYIIISPDTLTASAGEYKRTVNEPNPEFNVAISGFDNGEDASVLEEQPVAATTATESSLVGVYDIVVSGGKAQNYIFRYVNGTLTVVDASDGINSIKANDKGLYDVYTIDGKAVKLGATSLDGIKRGLYIINDKKYIVK